MLPEDTMVKLLIGLLAPGQLDLFIPAVQAHGSTGGIIQAVRRGEKEVVFG